MLLICRIIFVAFIFSHTLAANAAPAQVTGRKVSADPTAPTIVFVNGIRNEPQKAADSSAALIRMLEGTWRSKSLPEDRYNHTYIYNWTDSTLGVDDVPEIRYQAEVSNMFSAPNYYEQLGTYYLGKNPVIIDGDTAEFKVIMFTLWLKAEIENILRTSSRVIIVPHSQGNLYVEAVYAMFVAEKRLDIVNRIRVVGVANTAKGSPNDMFVSHTEDLALKSMQVVEAGLSNFAHEPPKLTLCWMYFLLPCGGVPWLTIDPVSHHDFVNVYLNPRLANVDTLESVPMIIYDYIEKSLDAPLIKTDIFDTFDSNALDATKWNAITWVPGYGSATVSGGQAHFANCQGADTQGKVSISGAKIVIEARFAGPKATGRDSHVELVDPSTGSIVQFGDTSYQSWGRYLHVSTNGTYELLGHYGGTTSAFKEYRVTLEGKTVTIERGDSLNNLPEKVVATLGRSVTDGNYYLRIGTGGCDGVYSPANFDWIRVATY